MFTATRISGSGGEDAAMRAMFAARTEVFVDLLGWQLPILAGKFELDQFDNTDARYLVLLDADGRHRASARLLRTDRPHLLDTVFPDLCGDVLPTGSTTLEITRFCLDRRQCARDRRLVRNQLVSALVDYALAHGIEAYTGVAEQAWLDQVMTFGWDCCTLAPARENGGRMLSALRITIDEETVGKLRKSGIYAPACSVLAPIAPFTTEMDS
ncbi:acyl-homoserine-lactone synthase [Sphingomonas sp. 8AM]|uniref:acyl-homoserine-lactone synthase n=1 Tax=Sphingomonas sp. 8AM TaxID=2653170 RepID=UPI0012F42671|nr:acyl-homoserine-lactone synthase [Sphingomonas sp. 8AM]VXC84256.1 Acyl-homoserine-lactone synthase [Sphingomonas sp. 8AM]